MAELPKDVIPMVEFGFSFERRESMKRIMFLLVLAVMFFPAVVYSADKEERIIVREGYIVPDGEMLIVDDLSVVCAARLISPALVDSISIPAMSAILLITTPDTAKCKESLIEGACTTQNYSIGTGASKETLFGYGGNGSGGLCDYCPVESILGRQLNVVAYEGARLNGDCRWAYPPAAPPSGPELWLSSDILSGSGRLMPISK